MRIFTLLFLFLSSILVNAQTALPDSIFAVHYRGGDYRKYYPNEEDDFLGAYDDKDSLVLIYVSNRKLFIAETTTKIHHIHPFEEGRFQAPINKFSKLVRNYEVEIKEELIKELLELINLELYEPYIKIDTIYPFETEEAWILTDTTNIPKDFSIDYYEIDTTYFHDLCNYYYHKMEKERMFFEPERDCQNPIDYKLLLDLLIEEGIENREMVRSSFKNFIWIYLEFPNKFIELYQIYPTGRVSEWSVSDSETETSIYLTNPKINKIIAKMISGLDGYQDEEGLMRFYLSR